MENRFLTKLLGVLCLAVFAWTNPLAAQTFAGAGNPQPIPMVGTGGFPCVGGPTTSVANAAALPPVNGSTAVGTGYIIDNVTIDLTHTFDSDLEIDLISPDGTIWDLSSDNGGAGNDYTMTVFQDGAPSITTGAPPFTGTFEAEEGPFATGFMGDNAAGNWTLSICDDAGGDSGTLLSWSITFVAIECEFVGLPGNITRNNDPGACEACIILPVPTAVGAACAGVPDPNSQVTLGPQTDNLNIAPFNPGQTTLGVTNFTIFGAVANAPAGSMVTISGDWNSDNSFFTENPTFDLETTFLGNLPFGGPDCQANNYSFTITAAEYNAAAADGQLDFEVGADNAVNDFCAIDQITTQIDYFTATLPFVNDYNGTQDASDCYPVGTTTVCYTTNLTVGGAVTSCFDVTVVDNEGPTFTNCPGNFIVNLDPGDCEYIFDYEPEAVDNCPPAPVNILLGAQNPVQSINCNIGNVSTGNQHFRTFIAAQELQYTGVNIGVTLDAAPGAILTANVYDNGAGTFPGAGPGTLVATGTGTATGGPTPYFLNFALTPTAAVPAGNEVVVEIIVPAGIIFFPGYGPGQNGPTWLQAAACGAPTPTDVTTFGIVNGLVMNVDGVPAGGVDVVQTVGVPSGTALPIGVHNFRYEASDAATPPNIGVCEFTITVKEFPNAITALACNDDVQVSLDETCNAVVGADMILEGGPYGCYDTRYSVSIDKNGDGNYTEDNLLDASNIGQWYNVKVTDLQTGNSCWGRIHVEDKLIPDLMCEEISILCSGDLTPGAVIAGSADEELMSGFSWASVGGNDEVLPVSGAPSNATVTDVNVDVDITHTWVGDLMVEVESPSGTVVQLFANQCGNTDDVDATFDDQAAGPIVCSGTPVISGTVQPQGNLSDFNGEPVNGDWIVRVGDGVAGDGGTINRVAVSVSFTGTNAFPVGGATVTGPNPDGSYTVLGFDACGPATLTFEDSDDPRQCQNISNVITRSWKLTDGSGNMSTCDQTINLLRATLADLVYPPNYDGQDEPALNCEDRCDPDDNRFCGPSNLYWNTLPNGHPSPYDELWGCGTVKCFGTGRPGGVGCGDIQSTFEDTRINICTTGPSDGCFKILRRWTILDWCTGEVDLHNQVIKVEDTEGPVINDIDNLTISTDVWRCEADWYATEAWLMDNCSSDPLAYTVESSGGIVDFINGRWKVSELTPGIYTITYRATDCCGNETVKQISLTVIDDVPPVVICDAHTVVSITTTGNINADHLGITKIFAHTFDDGSFDNCSPDIWFKAIRMNEFNSNGNSKNGEDVRLGDWASIDCDAANGDDDLRVFPPWYQGPQSYFDDYVKFCCADIEDGPIMVVFRVYDVDPDPYTFGRQFPFLIPSRETAADYKGVLPEAQAQGGPLYGHYSDCMVEVSVQDKLPPYVVAPDPITVTCDFWFAFDPDNPNDYTDELDAVFGKVVTGPGAADPANRDSIVIKDRVCPAHPRFAEFAPATIFDDPCYDDKYHIFWGYDGYAIDNCDLELEQTIIPNLHCGRGSILRRWRATDPAGNWSNTATQRITIIDCKEWYVPTSCWRFTPKDVSECDLINVTAAGIGVCNNIFDPNRAGLNYLIKLIEWPCDVDVTTCQGQGNGLGAFHPDNLAVTFEQDRRPRLDDDNCNLLASTYTDEVYTFVDGACLKIFRHWKVIDWCLYEDFVNGVYFGDWSWEWTQVIKLLNQTGPVFADCSDKTFCGYGDPNNPNNPQCVGIIELRPDVSDDCTPLEQLRIDFKLDAFNDGSYDLLGYSDTYGNVYPFPNPDFLPVRRFAPEDANADGTYPVGTHRILWGAEDGCGNATVCEYLFTIEDCKPPTAYCEIGISTIPMPPNAGGYVDIWASDFDLGSFDNCTAQADLVFSFSTDINDRSRRLTCADAGSQLNYTVYVWDEAGNYASCLVGVVLNGCDGNGPFNLTGSVSDEQGRMVEEVMMDLDGTTNSTEIMTDVTGIFDFLNLEANQNITLTPEKDIDPRNGVTTFDLVLMSKHILGVQSLNSPYKMIAADVNKSGTITTFDMVELRKLILYIDNDFRSNTSWRFVDRNFVFPNATNPFATAFPEVYSINGLSQDEVADFIAVKIGDVNSSASPSSLIDSEDRAGGDDLIFSIDDRMLTAGNEYTVDFQAKDFAAINGYQFTLNFNTDAVEYTGVESGALTVDAGNFGTSLLDRGALTTSWSSFEATDLDDEAVVFSVTFRATKDVLLSNVLSASSDYTVAQAYTEDLEIKGVSIEFNSGAIVTNQFELMQNQPNPFRNETVIGFNLPQAGSATMTIYDVSGRVLKLIDGDYAKGYNEVSINRSELTASGVLYYTLETDTDSATKKMIVVE